MKKLILFLLLIPSLCFAEILTIPPEDVKDITITNLQAQVTSQNVVIKMLLKKTGCTINQDKLICPDIIEKEEIK